MVHVPYEQRPYHSARAVEQLPTESNLLGIWGFILSLLALFLTCGVLSPLALLVSLFGLLWRPRGFAVAGTVVSGLATLVLAVAVGTWWSAAAEVRADYEKGVQTEETHHAITRAHQAIAEYRNEHEGQLPGPVEGNKRVLVFSDGWQTELRYDRGDDSESYTIRSAGPDKEFDTPDDIVQSNSP
jgi:hypothetical protein